MPEMGATSTNTTAQVPLWRGMPAGSGPGNEMNTVGAKEEVLFVAGTGINNTRFFVVLPIQALPTAITIFHELSFKSNTALWTDKEAGIREDHKVGNHFGDAELSKSLQETRRHGYSLRISLSFHCLIGCGH